MTYQADSMDKRLLELLQADASLSHDTLATMLNIDVTSVKERISALEEAGILKGYQAVIDWERVDDNRATAIIQLSVSPEPDQGFDKVAERIMEFDEVEGVYLMSGGYDLTVIVQGKSMRDIALFVARRLSTIKSVLSTTTHFILTRYKNDNVIYHKGGIQEDRRNIFDD